jgi:hypothetical protein
MAGENQDWGCAASAGTQPYDDMAGLHSNALGAVGRDDFFTTEVLTLRGLVTYYVLFFIHLESRRVDIARITIHRTSRG